MRNSDEEMWINPPYNGEGQTQYGAHQFSKQKSAHNGSQINRGAPPFFRIMCHAYTIWLKDKANVTGRKSKQRVSVSSSLLLNENCMSVGPRFESWGRQVHLQLCYSKKYTRNIIFTLSWRDKNKVLKHNGVLRYKKTYTQQAKIQGDSRCKN